MSEPAPDQPELEFFNTVGGSLEIELTVPAAPAGDLLNLIAPEEARLARLELRPEMFNRDTGEFRPRTEEELSRVAFRGRSIRLRGESEDVVKYPAPNGEFFTVRELLRAVEETERQTRDRSDWFGGVDVDHIFFEGIERDEDGVWQIRWGS